MFKRSDKAFSALHQSGHKALISFITAGDPDYATSLEILKGLPKAGADIIELGMPFSDPMADGPAIQKASQRALKGGQTLRKTLEMVRSFRKTDETTPIVLMGYYNPIYVFPVDRFLAEAAEAGVDGLIVVDVPPEADDELCIPALKAGLNSSGSRRPQQTIGVSGPCSRIPAALSITSPSQASPGQGRPTSTRSRRMSRG